MVVVEAVRAWQADLCAISMGLRLCLTKGITTIWIEVDPTTAILIFFLIEEKHGP